MVAEPYVQRTIDGGVVVYRISGTFDRASAWALRERIENDPEDGILLDFTRTREFSDLAVAVLAHGLAGGTHRVGFRGVGQHELRILRYCGVPVDGPEAPPVADPRAMTGEGPTVGAP